MSSDTVPDGTADRIEHYIETEGDAVAANTRGFNDGRYESTADLPEYERLRDRARSIKEDAIDRLPELIDELRSTVEANGGSVYIADDAADATEHIREIVAEREAERLIKSKSMTSEEIEINEALAADGVDVVETDLGEWVLQVADETPSHIVAPAIHKSRDEIGDLFADAFDPEADLETAEDLTAFARDRLGDLIEEAEVGMTGANFIAADSGTMALVTSEGNARKTVAATDTHIAVAGVEKIVPSVEDIAPFVELIGRSGTGQDITSYVSMLTPPVESPVPDFDAADQPLDTETDRSFHLVLLDNGRLDLREDDDLRETLYCIRCSACSNACGNFQSVGGHVFGGETYSGGIATGWEAGVEGLESTAEFNDLCTGCSRCVPACPVKIDIPWINTVVRDRLNRKKASPEALGWVYDELVPDEEPGGLSLQKRLAGNFRTLAQLGSATAPLSNWLANARPVRLVMEAVADFDRRRDLPAFARQDFYRWFQSRGEAAVDPADADRTVVLYPDTYTRYIAPERGRAAVHVLEALDVHVRVPDLPGSGRPPLSQGMIATAERQAEAVADALQPHLEADRDVVVIEPSDAAMFRSAYRRLLDDDEFEPIRTGSYELMEYVYGLLETGGDADALADPGADDPGVAYHPHCQARTIDVAEYTTAVLEAVGYDVRTSDTECCGMAGSFGYKSEYYELSMDVGEPLREQFGGTDRTVVAPGISCSDQLEALLNRSARHPIELLAP